MAERLSLQKRELAYGLSVKSQASRSAFSAAVHSRPTTSLQLRRNHFSVFVASVNRSGLNAGARGAIALPVAACFPVCVGTAPWQAAQVHSRPCNALKNCCPREASGVAPPDCAWYAPRSSDGVAALDVAAAVAVGISRSATRNPRAEKSNVLKSFSGRYRPSCGAFLTGFLSAASSLLPVPRRLRWQVCSSLSPNFATVDTLVATGECFDAHQ